MTGDTLRITDRNNSNKYSEISPSGAYFKRGALTIERPDGALYIENGIPKMNMEIQRNVFMHPSVRFDGQNYVGDSETDFKSYENVYTTHGARYLVVNFGVSLTTNSVSPSAYINVRVRGFGSSSNILATKRIIAYSDSRGTNFEAIIIDLGTPTYEPIQFYLEFALDSQRAGNTPRIRSNRVYMYG